VWRIINRAAFADLRHDRTRRLRPGKRLGMSIVFRDVSGDCAFEFANAPKRAAPDSLCGDVREEPLNRVQPGRTRWGKVNVVAWMRREPSLDRGILVGRIVIHNYVDVELRRHVLINVIEKLHKLAMTVARQTALNHGPV